MTIRATLDIQIFKMTSNFTLRVSDPYHETLCIYALPIYSVDSLKVSIN